jgi:hypothetical protein
VNDLRRNQTEPRLDHANPSVIIEFNQVEQVEGAGWYPREIVSTKIDLEPTTSGDNSGSDLINGWQRRETLKVGLVKANEAVEDIQILLFPNGTHVLDGDTKAGRVIGKNSEELIRGLVPRIFGISKMAWIIIVNIFALIAIVITMWIAKRKRR